MSEDFKKRLANLGILKIGLILITYIFLLVYSSTIFTFISRFGVLLTPFIFGFSIAYLLNPIITLVHTFLVRIFHRDFSTEFSLFIGYFIITIVFIFLCVNLFPQVWYSLDVIVKEIPSAIESSYTWLEVDGVKLLSNITNNKVALSDIKGVLLPNLEPLLTDLSNSLGKLLSATVSITTFFFNLILGFLISVYMLVRKTKYKAQTKKILYAFLNVSTASKVISFFKSAHLTFSRFINARIVDSLIICILCYIGCLLFGFDNAILISIIIGITNVIPYLGPFLGAIPCSFIILMQSPNDMFIFIVFILILQQFDGNILGPKLLGDSLGLTSLWVIFAVVIMTGLFGVVGMFIGVPLFTILYMFVRDLIYVKLKKKGLSLNTDDYE